MISLSSVPMIMHYLPGPYLNLSIKILRSFGVTNLFIIASEQHC